MKFFGSFFLVMIVLAGCWAGAFADWDCISHESFVRCTGSASKISKSGDIDSIVIDSFFRITLDLAGIPLQPIFSNNTNPFYFSYVYDVNLGWYNCVGASCHAAVTQPHSQSIYHLQCPHRPILSQVCFIMQSRNHR